jgi:hypothetical protein
MFPIHLFAAILSLLKENCHKDLFHPIFTAHLM